MATLGALPGVLAALAAARHPSPLLRRTGALLGLGLGVIGDGAAATLSAAREGLNALKSNQYGLCNGSGGKGDPSPAGPD